MSSEEGGVVSVLEKVHRGWRLWGICRVEEVEEWGEDATLG